MQMYRKIISKELPDAIKRIKDQHVLQFIQQCLTEAEMRPTAAQLC